MKKRFKKIYETTLVILFILFCLVSTATGLWFLEGGDLRDLPNGCYNSNGCE